MYVTDEEVALTGLDLAHNSMRSRISRAGNQKSTWIVIPAYNESTRLPRVLRELTAGQCHSVVVVDDGSADGTAEVAKQFGVAVLRHMVNRGQGAALLTGIEFALEHGADWIVTFDADGQHRSDDVEHILAPLRADRADLVLGSRFLGNAIGIPFLRRVVLRLAIWFTRFTTGLKLTDTHNGLRGFQREVARKLTLSEDGMAHASEILRLAGHHRLRIEEVPVTVHYTADTLAKGQSTRSAFGILGRILVRKIVS